MGIVVSVDLSGQSLNGDIFGSNSWAYCAAHEMFKNEEKGHGI